MGCRRPGGEATAVAVHDDRKALSCSRRNPTTRHTGDRLEALARSSRQGNVGDCLDPSLPIGLDRRVGIDDRGRDRLLDRSPRRH